MARTRSYSVTFNNISVGAVQDVVAIYTGASKAIEIHEVNAGQASATSIGNLRIRLYQLTATVTSGSGGSAGSIYKFNQGDAAATVTSRINDTVQATGGSVIQHHSEAFNVINGFLYSPLEDDRPVIGLNSAFVFSLDQAPNPAQVWNVTVKFAELF
jgi:hypothetical protein